MNQLEFCKAYIAYTTAMINANRLPLTAIEYAERMEFETENLYTDADNVEQRTSSALAFLNVEININQN